MNGKGNEDREGRKIKGHATGVKNTLSGRKKLSKGTRLMGKNKCKTSKLGEGAMLDNRILVSL